MENKGAACAQRGGGKTAARSVHSSGHGPRGAEEGFAQGGAVTVALPEVSTTPALSLSLSLFPAPRLARGTGGRAGGPTLADNSATPIPGAWWGRHSPLRQRGTLRRTTFIPSDDAPTRAATRCSSLFVQPRPLAFPGLSHQAATQRDPRCGL